MAVFYNTDGSVSEIVINAIINGKVTSSLSSAPTIQQSFEASSSNAMFNRAVSAGSSSKDAYELAYPTDKSDWSLRNGKLTSPKNQ